jgi:peptide/nickel transport system ATP-binding protein|tara:strand:- start:410 stop:1408 length:999 start_codon:yes stop_codon:yes gene_type:complete
MTELLLELRDLRTQFFTSEGVVSAVDGVSLRIRSGETLAVVGESGCGKSVMARSILRLIPNPPGKIVDGEVLYRGTDLLKLNTEQMCDIRGKEISMIFQEPMTSLNPVLTVGDQVAEAVLEHEKVGRKDIQARVVELFRLVNIPAAASRVKDYPHQLSGGMRQRVMIAMALACRPKILIADEPTTALDVTIQAQILDLITRLKEEFGMGVLLITHDLGVVAETAQQVVVMYAGRKVEEAPVELLFDAPLHPYTRGLLDCVPRLDSFEQEVPSRLHTVEGLVPSLTDMPPGCAFAPRCPMVTGQCRQQKPEIKEVRPGHLVSCFVAQNGRQGP